MNKDQKETDARIVIDRLLREAGWDIEDKTQVSTEEAAADGRADYLLKDAQGRRIYWVGMPFLALLSFLLTISNHFRLLFQEDFIITS